ncbi:TPA: thioredoxin [Candidatus Saccharibacteria bacterium]|nr:thioredoxin [Candidatus Saccharibacteria bacterium]HIO87495.1 thioredoxin [Candidatus Saccharibacteria bacterium]
MNKTTLGVGIFVALFVAGLGYLIVSSDDTPDTANTSPSSNSQTETSTTQEDGSSETSQAVSGIYTDYSQKALTNAEGQVVLFFHAPWCPQCRQMEADILANGTPAGYTILKVDYDSNQDLRDFYGIRLQTSFIKVSNDGTAQDEVYIAYNEPTLATLANDYLN